MTPNDLPALITTFGPIGVVIWWVLKTQISAKEDEHKADPMLQELTAIRGFLSALDKRLAVVETILEERKK